MKIYIAGPMSGMKDHNFPVFNSAEKWLREQGYDVLNPATLDETDSDNPWQYYLRRDIPLMLQQCQAIALLPGWEKSVGACRELFDAAGLGLEVFEMAVVLPGDEKHEPMHWTLVKITDTKEVYYMTYDAAETILKKMRSEVLPEDEKPPTLKLVQPDEEEESVCQEADRLISRDRQNDYGHPFYDFSRTGRMWGAVLGTPDIPPEYVALCMATLKISRQCNKSKRDNIVDGIGYLGTIEKIEQKRMQMAVQQQKAS